MLRVLLSFMIATLALSNNLQFPPFSPMDVERTVLWKCWYSGPEKVNYHNLFDHIQSEVLSHRDNWLTILSSSLQENDLAAMNLHPCRRLVNITQLVAVEWEQNFQPWHSLSDQHWSGMKSVSNKGRFQRSVSERDDVNSGSLSYRFTHYKNYSAMVEWYEALVDQHPSVMRIHSIGKSYHGRDINAIHFTSTSRKSSVERPIVYVQCLVHPREWISGPVCMYIARQLTGHNSQLLDQVDVVMVPIANPDGYYLTWYNYPKYRLWRKNAEPLSGSDCMGVDLNRNFDSHWHDSVDPYADQKCSAIYRGTSPASSLEVKILSRFIKSLGHRAVGFLDIHSFNKRIFYPPAWRDENPADIDVIRSVAEAMTGAMRKIGSMYTAMRMVDLYAASGTFPDWLLDYRQSEGSCPSLIPLTMELRPSEQSVIDSNDISRGFLLPPTEIIPTCIEAFVGFKEFIRQVTRTGKTCLKSHLLEKY